MDIAIHITAFAALVGTGMGLASLAVPRWGARLVRLTPDPRWKGGWAEFRASYGGAFALGHGAVLLTYLMRDQAGMASLTGAGFAMGAVWVGMALGRGVSMVADNASHETRTAYNLMSTGFELLMGLALWAPFLAHLGGRG